MLKPCFSYLVKSWWSGCICWFSSLETTGVCTNCSPCSGCFGSWESQWFCGHEPGTAESTHTSRLICGLLFWAVDANGAQISGSFGSPVAPAEPSCFKWTLFVCSCSIGGGPREEPLRLNSVTVELHASNLEINLSAWRRSQLTHSEIIWNTGRKRPLKKGSEDQIQ